MLSSHRPQGAGDARVHGERGPTTPWPARTRSSLDALSVRLGVLWVIRRRPRLSIWLARQGPPDWDAGDADHAHSLSPVAALMGRHRGQHLALTEAARLGDSIG